MPARFPTFFFTLAVLGVGGRGLFQVFIGKNAAYAVQAALILAFMLILVVRGRSQATRHQLKNLFLFLLFCVAAFLSAVITEGPSATALLIYIAVMCFLAFLLFFFSSLTFDFQATNAPGRVLVVFCFVLVTVAFLQQHQSLELFPGSDYGTFGTTARPSSLTGSFLHYPLVTSLLTFIFLGLYGQQRNKLYLIAGLVAIAGTFSSYSRSGMVLTLVGLVAGTLMSRGVNSKIRLVLGFAAGVPAFLFLFPIEGLGDRFFSIFDTEGAGNVGRVSAWLGAFEHWLDSPILLGAYTSAHSNITANLAALEQDGAAESSIFQLLLSFGLLGLLAYYGLILASFRACIDIPVWFRAGLVGAIVQSCFYQSIEVLPFMALLALMPFISLSLAVPSGLSSMKTKVKRMDEVRGPDLPTGGHVSLH